MIIGAGGIGSRHLQGLRSLRRSVDIHLIDPSPEALATSQQRWEEAPAGGDHHLTSATGFDRPLGEPALVIVATTSRVRLQVLRELLAQSRPRHVVLEKFLFPAASEYSEAAELLASAGTRAWVNTARRLWPAYAQLRDGLDTSGPVSLRVTAQDAHGLGSNAVHFLDLVTYLTGRPSGVLDPALLRPVPNRRRSASIEFEGSIQGFNSSGDHFAFTTLPSSAPLLVQVTTPTQHHVVDETNQTILSADAASAWQWRPAPFRVPFQSELTGELAERLMTEDTCDLPDLSGASISHLSLLEAFLSVYRHHVDEDTDLCPVT